MLDGSKSLLYAESDETTSYDRRIRAVAYYPTVFNQLFNFIPRHVLEKASLRYGGDRYVKGFTTWRHFLVLLYAQVTMKQSLREIETGLATQRPKLYHLGLRAVARSTLSDAMARRDPAIFEALFNAILGRTAHVAPRHRFQFKNPLRSIDSTTIDLCLSMFDWAKFRTTKGAIKLHCHLDHCGHIPAFLLIEEGRFHDITVARQQMELVPESIYCFDRGYTDFKWLYSLDKQGVFFVTFARKNMRFRVTGQHPRTHRRGIENDQYIQLTGQNSSRRYPSTLRLVSYRDPETNKLYRFLTNNFKLAAATIAEIYRQRWQIEIFFRWIKQNLKIKTFLGTSRQAVMAQVWVAMIYYLLLSYIKFLNRCNHSITELTRRIKEALMHRFDLMELLTLNVSDRPPGNQFIDDYQLVFNFT